MRRIDKARMRRLGKRLLIGLTIGALIGLVLIVIVRWVYPW